MTLQPPPPPAVAPAPEPPRPAVRAQYVWGYVGAEGEGKGDLSVLVDPATGRVVMELHGLGERLMLLEGDRASGYRLQVPRQGLDTRAADLAGLPLPFLPLVGNAEGLHRLLSEGTGPGVKVTRRDGLSPVKLRYDGRDDRGKEVQVWLDRKRWEPVKP